MTGRLTKLLEAQPPAGVTVTESPTGPICPAVNLTWRVAAPEVMVAFVATQAYVVAVPLGAEAMFPVESAQTCWGAVIVESGACLTVWLWPPTVRMPVRAMPVFGCTSYVNVPLPVPLPPDWIVTHGMVPVTDQVQPVAVVTVTAADPPSGWKQVLAGLSEYVQPEAWLTEKVFPPIVAVAVLAGPGLGDTE